MLPDEMDSVVPFWMRCVPLAMALFYAPLLYVLLRGANWLALRQYRRALRRDPNLHWTERARLALGPRSFAVVALFGMPFQGAVLVGASVGPLSLLSAQEMQWVTGLSCFLGAYLALRQLGLELGFGRTPTWYDLRATAFGLHGVLVLGAAVLGFWGLGSAIAEGHWGRIPVAILPVALLWGPTQTLLFRAVGLYRRDAALLASLEPVFEATGIRPRAVWVVPTSVANALAYPLRKTIVVTERLLEVLSPDERAAVIAHELGHLKEGNKAWWRLGVLWAVCGASFAYPFMGGDNSTVFILGALGAFFSMLLVFRIWSRRREHEADSVAVAVSDAGVYARALEKLYEVNLYPATQRGGTHPSLYDRLERAGITPAYPRPALPSRKPNPAGLLAVTLFPVVLVTWPYVWRAGSGDSPAVAAVVTQGAHPLSRLALTAWEEGNTKDAIALYRRAEELDDRSPWYSRNLAAVLKQTGDCAGAREAAERAFAKAGEDPRVASELFTVECDGAEAPVEAR